MHSSIDERQVVYICLRASHWIWCWFRTQTGDRTCFAFWDIFSVVAHQNAGLDCVVHVCIAWQVWHFITPIVYNGWIVWPTFSSRPKFDSIIETDFGNRFNGTHRVFCVQQLAVRYASFSLEIWNNWPYRRHSIKSKYVSYLVSASAINCSIFIIQLEKNFDWCWTGHVTEAISSFWNNGTKTLN